MIKTNRMTGVATVVLLAFAMAETRAQPVGGEDIAAIEQLVAELGDDSFAARQAAMKKIWRSQKLSLETLRRYARTADPEARERLHRIIRHIELGITPETDPEVARLVFAFYRADEEQKFDVMHRLRDAGHHRLVMDLLMAIEDPAQRDYLARDAYESGEDLPGLLMPLGFDSEKLAELDGLMDHRYMWKNHIADCIAYWSLRGQAAARTAALRDRVSRGQVTDEALLQLVWFHRLAGQQAQSLKYARQLKDPRPEVVQRLLLENGAWDVLAASYRPHLEHEESTLTTLCKEAMFRYWADDREGLDETNARIARRLAGSSDSLQTALANANGVLSLTTLDRQRMFDHIENMSPGFAFRLLSHVQEYERAFRLQDAPQEFVDIKRWYRRKIRELRGKISRYENRDSREDLVRAVDLFGFLRHYAANYGSLVDVPQAVELYELLADGVKLNGYFFRNWNTQLFDDVSQLDIGEDIWHFFDVLEMASTFPRAADALFPESSQEAAVWYAMLEDEFPDPVDRGKVIGAMLKGPFASDQEVDFERFVEIALDKAEQLPDHSRANVLLHVGETCHALGDRQRARDIWLQSGYQGNEEAFVHLGDRAAREQRWNQARQWYLQASQVQPDGSGLYKAALCDSRLDHPDQAADRMRQMRIMVLHSFDLYRLAFEVQEIGFPEEALELMFRFSRGQDFQHHDLFYDFQYIATLLDETGSDLSERYWAIAIHFYLTYLEISADSGLRYHFLGMQQHRAAARNLLKRGEIRPAFEKIKQCARMASSSTSLAEEFVRRLEEAEQPERASELFDMLANRYLDVLTKYPRSALHHNNYAWACARCQRRLEDASRHARRAVELEPGNTSYLDTLAEIAWLQGDVPRSIELIRKCIERDPFKQHYRDQLARFEKAAGSDADQAN